MLNSSNFNSNLISAKTAETLNTKATISIIPDLHQKLFVENPTSSPIYSCIKMSRNALSSDSNSKNHQFK